MSDPTYSNAFWAAIKSDTENSEKVRERALKTRPLTEKETTIKRLIRRSNPSL